MIFRILIEHSHSSKVSDDVPVDAPLLYEIGIYPAHIVVGGRQRKGLLRCRLSLFYLLKFLPLLPIQQFRDRLLEGASVIHPHEVDGVTALLGIMVEPFAASDGHTVI